MRFFHLSFDKDLPNVLYPRQPYGLDNKDNAGENVFRENLPDRVSFSPSIIGCLRAIYPNISNLVESKHNLCILTFQLYEIFPERDSVFYWHELEDEILDAFITKECISLSPCYCKYLGERSFIIDHKGDHLKISVDKGEIDHSLKNIKSI